MSPSLIPEPILEKLKYVASIIGDTSNDWPTIKLQIVAFLPKNLRKNFSARHKTTKKQIVNEFELLIMKQWEEITGVKPIISPEKLHDPNWSGNEKGWGLKLFNERRRLTNAKNQ